MAWDDTKADGGTLTAAEYNAHVTDQKGHKARHQAGGTDIVDADTLDTKHFTDIQTDAQGKVNTHAALDVAAGVHPNAKTHIDAVAPHSAHESTANKDASAGYVGKTLEKLNIYNAARTFLNQIVAAATTAIRTWTFPDKDITVAGTVDISDHAVLATGVHGVGASTVETIAGSQAKVDAHVNDATAAHAGTAISNTPAGTIAATDVQAAINELDTEKETPSGAQAKVDTHKAADVSATVHPNANTHIGNTSNPHSVTKAQVGLTNVTDDAQLKRAEGDINTFTEKTTPVSADILLLEDSAASYAKKKVQVGNLPFLLNKYGVAWNEADDTYVRTGSLAGVAVGSSPGNVLLPIQAAMRRCVMNDSGVVQYYLDPADSTKKVGGGAAILTGADGQVMVEIPAFYYRYAYSGTTHTWEISQVPLAGFSLHPAFIKNGVFVPYRYIGAYEGVLYDVSASIYTDGIYQTAVSCVFANADSSLTIASRSGVFSKLTVGDKLVVSGTTSNNGTKTVASLVSATKITISEAVTDETAAATVVETQTDWTATSGDKLSSVSGKAPINWGTRANFRAVAKNRGTGWRQQDYDLISAIQLLYLVEYASFYSQSMIGASITNVGDWGVYNNYNPIAATGNSNVIGNMTGNTAGATAAATEVTKYHSYRGIEYFFGHLCKWYDGININSNVPYVSNNDTQFADDTATNYTALGVTLINTEGWQNTLQKQDRGFLPLTVGATSTTRITDYYWQSSGWRVAALGGHADGGAHAGAFFALLDLASSGLGQAVGGRLAF